MTTDQAFTGFQSPTSNTTYTPNQYFDVVLSSASRGVVRLVAYMIRKTLGWSDSAGRPQEAHISLSYRDLQTHAGIAQSKLRAALDDAIAARFIQCVRPGNSHLPGTQGSSALYELCWDERDIYVTDPEAFQGFYAGNGNLTYIPNEFFDVLIPLEPLAVIKVVGAIIRNTIGFQTRYGLRRQVIALSFTHLQRKTGIVSRRSLNEALHQALDRHYLRVVETGYFDPQAGKESRAATYGVHWREETPPNAKESAPCRDQSDPATGGPDASKRIPEKRLQKDTGNASKRIPGTLPEGYRYRNNSLNNSLNLQQQPEPEAVTVTVAVVLEFDSQTELLLAAGFDARTATSLAQRFPNDRIERQCRWLPLRAVRQNRLGLLRRAIEEDWPEPVTPLPVTPAHDAKTEAASQFVRYFYASLAGNKGEPVAPPSSNDVQVALSYVTRLRAVCPEGGGVEAWGREFGVFVQTSEQQNGKIPRSFVVAMRVCGDAYYLDFRARRQQETRQLHSDTRRQHSVRFQAAYETYLREQEALLLEESAALMEAFYAYEVQERQKIETGSKSRGALLRIQLRSFDTDEQHRERLRTFFRDNLSANMFDFWKWDEMCNPQGLKQLRTTPS